MSPRFILVLLFSSLLSRSVKAQVPSQVPPQFSVDTVTSAVTSSLPFDRPFVLRLTGTNAKSIYTGAILEWKIKNGKKVFRMRGENEVKLIPIELSDVYPRKNGVDIYIRPLSPDKNIAIMLGHHFDGPLLSEILQINTMIQSGQDPAAITGRLLSLHNLVEQQVGGAFDTPDSVLRKVTFFATRWNNIGRDYRSFYQASLRGHYDAMTQLRSGTYAGFDIPTLQLVASIADAAKISSTELSIIGSLIVRNLILETLDGSIPVSKDFAGPAAAEFQLERRLGNLNNSIQGIEKLIQFLESLQLRSASVSIRDLRAGCVSLKADLEHNRNVVKNAYEGIVAAINNEVNLTYGSWAFGNNDVSDLKIRGSYQIIPEIGLTNIFAIGNGENENIVRPYVGAAIYLRPVDKSIPFKYLTHRFLHRFSFNLGVTTGKIEQGEFTDFYNSVSILVGGNYKITREFSISVGGAFLQRKNSNPAIKETTTTINPYVSLSFDVDFATTIQKLSGKIF